eukprot:9468745-Pyramimonas_sp.AAC.1
MDLATEQWRCTGIVALLNVESCRGAANRGPDMRRPDFFGTASLEVPTPSPGPVFPSRGVV